MKAITVRQPWGWAIFRLGKDVENRKGNIAGNYRGPLVIHTGKKPIGAMDPGRYFIHRVSGYLPLIEHPSGLGVALGVVDLIDTHPSASCIEPIAVDPAIRYCSPWGMDTDWHLVLSNPRPFPEPIPYCGHLGLWNFPDELLPDGWDS